MTSSLDIDGKKMLSIKSVSTLTGYSRDYITRLAREQKIIASQLGRNWFVDLDSLQHYSATIEIEQQARQQQLSIERKQELKLKELLEKKELEQAQLKHRLARRSKILAAAVLFLGLSSGLVIERVPFVSIQLHHQVASVPFIQWFRGDVDIATAAEKREILATPAGAEVVNFSHESFRLSTMAQPADGVLLLPSATSGTSSLTDVKKLFSDDVRILKGQDGEQYVAQVNTKGEVVRKIPFVVVPVSTRKTS
jgi:hypothetical protein